MLRIDRIKNFKINFLVTILVLCVIGGVVVFSTTFYPDKLVSQTFFQQIFFYVVGFFVFTLISLIDFNLFKSRIILLSGTALTIILLILVLIIGVSAGEAQRWIDLGSFTIQPSEFAKLCVIFLAAYGLSSSKKIIDQSTLKPVTSSLEDKSLLTFLKSNEFKRGVTSFVAIVLVISLVFLQKSLGNTLLTIGIILAISFFKIQFKFNLIVYIAWIVLSLVIAFEFLPIIYIAIFFLLLLLITFISKASLMFAAIIFLSSLGLPLALNFAFNNVMTDYQRQRVVSYLNPSEGSDLNENWNSRQAMAATGAGQLLGRGFLNGNIVKYQLLPYPYTDFAFASFSEQFGFVGSFSIIAIYVILLIQIVNISLRSNDQYNSLIAVGIGAMVFFNMLQHIGMNVGLAPITGVPLPLISYGGSSVITIFAGLGIVHSIYMQNLEQEKNYETISV